MFGVILFVNSFSNIWGEAYHQEWFIFNPVDSHHKWLNLEGCFKPMFS